MLAFHFHSFSSIISINPAFSSSESNLLNWHRFNFIIKFPCFIYIVLYNVFVLFRLVQCVCVCMRACVCVCVCGQQNIFGSSCRAFCFFGCVSLFSSVISCVKENGLWFIGHFDNRGEREWEKERKIICEAHKLLSARHFDTFCSLVVFEYTVSFFSLSLSLRISIDIFSYSDDLKIDSRPKTINKKTGNRLASVNWPKGHERIHNKQPTNKRKHNTNKMFADNSLLLSNQAKGEFDLFMLGFWWLWNEKDPKNIPRYEL